MLFVALALSPLTGSYYLVDHAIEYGWKVGKMAGVTECHNGGEARRFLLKSASL